MCGRFEEGMTSLPVTSIVIYYIGRSGEDMIMRVYTFSILTYF